MSIKHLAPTAALVACVLAGLAPASAQAEGPERKKGTAVLREDGSRVIRLTGTLRDFKISHPDMQGDTGENGHVRGLVEDELDEEGKPVLKAERAGEGRTSTVDNFRQWFRPVEGVNREVPHSIELEEISSRPGFFEFRRDKSNRGAERFFFPLDNHPDAWSEHHTTYWGTRNYYFTYEIETRFTFTDPTRSGREDMIFSFYGDDDIWVFINNKLAVDLGGVHGQIRDTVNLDESMEELGLEYGQTYDLKLFFAERRQSQSNFRLTTSINLESDGPENLYD